MERVQSGATGPLPSPGTVRDKALDAPRAPRFATPSELTEALGAGDVFAVREAFPNIYATTDQVAGAGEIERGTVGDWVRAGLLPAPGGSGGRGNKARFPLFAVTLAKFIREQRKQGFGLPDLRPIMVATFCPRILELLAPPRESRSELAKRKQQERSQE
ncbi:hypothetical protein [Nannocystis bainbridge]|uniref:MerR HTH family regulatory protein n=1 Tax=Nannocystis bainbridge TaxID=2995303 RepID=A0ABT5DRG3_9BACT|nr:hypothetical protein [Nannocystis bainbridge]MDC0716136.1 hypothetical protein [Nannocystis bainbridge]